MTSWSEDVDDIIYSEIDINNFGYTWREEGVVYTINDLNKLRSSIISSIREETINNILQE